MNESRWREITQRVRDHRQDLSVSRRICFVGAEMLDADYVSIAMVVNNSYSPVASTDDVSVFLDEQQFSLGNGPTFEARNSEAPVLANDLHKRDNQARWPAVIPSFTNHNINAAFAFPLRIGSAYIGVLTFYRTKPGELTAIEFADGLFLATFATAELVKERAGVITGDFDTVADIHSFEQSTIQVAAGMVAEYLNCSIIDALVRIRARAFVDDLPVSVVARKIVAREITIAE